MRVRVAAILGVWRPGSGPVVARVLHRLLAATFLVAWASLGVQVHVLIGQRGLLPIAPFLDAARTRGAPTFAEFPTVFWLGAGDVALTAGIVAGLVLAAAALAGFQPRVCGAASAALYLSYATACRAFLAFQWDNLLLESAALAVFLPRRRAAPVAHLAFRLLLFKLYFESGIAKWQSHLGDWQDGSAMTFYYETAPIPGPFAWHAHALPAGWHHFESWAALTLELAVPFLIFGPRRLRLLAFAAFTGFQLIDILTANYGFFCYLAAALGVFLLDDADLVRARAWLLARLKRPLFDVAPSPAPVRWPRARTAAAVAALAAYAGLSAAQAGVHFTDSEAWSRAVEPVLDRTQPWRLVNTYHLFGHITRERIEPEFQTFDGTAWTAHDLKYKPGDLARAPPLAAPHQPRVDFQLWFYGLAHERGEPEYVWRLLTRICDDPPAVQGLFEAPLPDRPRAARVAFWRYHFTTPEERSASGAFWKREWVGATPRLCGTVK